MGHRVDIIAADYSHLRRINPEVEYDFQQEQIDDITYYWVKTNKYEGNGIARAKTMFKFVGKLYRKAKWIVDELKPDVVICSSTYPLDTYVGQKIRKVSKKKVKLIHEVHDMWPATLIEIGGMSKYNPFIVMMQIAENSAYKKSDKVISLLSNSEQYMIKHGLSKGKFRCIPNGIVEEEWENPLPLPEKHRAFFEKLKKENKFVLGYFGGHALSNSLEQLVDAASIIEDDDIHFVLVGEGVKKEFLIKKSKELDLKNITFLSPIPKKAIPTLCSKLDCIFMAGNESPLYRFGLSLNKMFDTMAAGKIGISAIGVKSYLTEYNCGFDIEANSPGEIVKIIEYIRRMNKQEQDDMKKNAKRAAQNVFNYKKLAKKFEEEFYGK